MYELADLWKIRRWTPQRYLVIILHLKSEVVTDLLHSILVVIWTHQEMYHL